MTKEKPAAAANDVVVTIEYTLVVDGEVLDSSEEEGPLPYLHGHANIVPGLEDALTGKKIGDRVQVTVPPEEGYGEYDDEAVHHVPRMEFPAEIPLEEGVELTVTDDEGDSAVATISWVGADEIRLDFNHPLAGEILEFDVTIVDLRRPTEEELDHGHAHTGDGHHHDHE